MPFYFLQGLSLFIDLLIYFAVITAVFI